MPNLRLALVNDFPGSAAFLCSYKLRRLQPMFSLMIYPRNQKTLGLSPRRVLEKSQALRETALLRGRLVINHKKEQQLM